MTRGQFHTPKIQWIMVRLSTRISKEEVSASTGVSIRSVERIIQHYNKYGSMKDLDL
jgi:transposase